MTSELKYTLAAALFVFLLVATYGVRVAVKGRARFDRIDRQGGSQLLSKGVMEVGYWILFPLAKVLVRLRVSPNRVSWSSFGFGFLAGACLAFGHFGFGAICATVSGLLDYYREIVGWQVLALLALLGSFMVSYSTTKAEALRIEPPKGLMRRPERAVYLTAGAALSAVSTSWFETAREFSSPLGYPMVLALGMVAVLGNVSSIERLWSIAKALRLREKQQTDGGTRT